MHTKGDNIENMMVSETGEVIKEHFETILQIYQKDLQESMRGSEFVF